MWASVGIILYSVKKEQLSLCQPECDSFKIKKSYIWFWILFERIVFLKIIYYNNIMNSFDHDNHVVIFFKHFDSPNMLTSIFIRINQRVTHWKHLFMIQEL